MRFCQDSHTLLTVAVIKGAPKAPAVVQAAAATQVAPSATLSSFEHKGARPNTDSQEVTARAPVDDVRQDLQEAKAAFLLLRFQLFGDGPPTSAPGRQSPLESP